MLTEPFGTPLLTSADTLVGSHHWFNRTGLVERAREQLMT